MSFERYLTGKLPQLTEIVADIGAGVLVIALIGPFVYVILNPPPLSFKMVISVFSRFWARLAQISLASGLMGIFIAYLVGIFSRTLFQIPLKNEKNPLRLGTIQIGKLLLSEYWPRIEEGDPVKSNEELIDKLISGSFFANRPDYFKYRAELSNPYSKLSALKPYWDHESFLYFQFFRSFSTFLFFFCLYFIYGFSIIIASWYHLNFLDWGAIAIWIFILSVIAVVNLTLLRELLLHGGAFYNIDRFLYKKFINFKDAERSCEQSSIA